MGPTYLVMSVRAAHGWLGAAMVAAWLCAAPIADAQVTYIETVAGTGATGGTNGPARKATFTSPYQLALLDDGALLIAEYGGNRIRKLSPDGTVSTVAGTGTAASGPDGGQATSTAINAPLGVAVAPDGQSFYLSESGGNRIRRVDPDGTITTVAGGNGAGAGGDGGPAGSAQMNYPYGLGTSTDGDLYFADQDNGRVRRIVAAGDEIVHATGTITTVASGFNKPTDVVVGDDGSLGVPDVWGHRIYSVSAGGAVSVLAGTGAMCGSGSGSSALCGDGGPAASALLSYPLHITADGNGGYYFSDRGSYRLRHISASGTISTVAGTGASCGATSLCGDGGAALGAQFYAPAGLALAPNGVLYVGDFALHRIRAISPLPSTAATGPQGPVGPQGPAGPQGSAGADGVDGAHGQPGSDGADGAAGQVGRDGAAGRDGTHGRDGVRGRAGADGHNASWNDMISMQVLLPAEAIMSRPARRAWVRLFVSGASTVEVTLRRDGQVVRRVKRRFKRIGRKRFNMGRLGRGRYEVLVVAVAATPDGELSASSIGRDSARLVVR